MKDAIRIDGSGRLVIPKAIRRELNLQDGARLRPAVVAGRIGLTPVAGANPPEPKQKAGLTILSAGATRTRAAAAVAEERQAQRERGVRR